jgi:hypothetical protein
MIASQSPAAITLGACTPASIERRLASRPTLENGETPNDHPPCPLLRSLSILSVLILNDDLCNEQSVDLVIRLCSSLVASGELEPDLVSAEPSHV